MFDFFLPRIHVEGKKHEKRLSHLKYSLENTDNSTPIYQVLVENTDISGTCREY